MAHNICIISLCESIKIPENYTYYPISSQEILLVLVLVVTFMTRTSMSKAFGSNQNCLLIKIKSFNHFQEMIPSDSGRQTFS